MKRKRSINSIIHDQLLGSTSEEDREQLQRWLDSSQENRENYERLMRENCLADRYREFAWVDEERAWKRFQEKHFPIRTFNWGKLVRYAAIFILPLIGLAVWLWGTYQMDSKPILSEETRVAMTRSEQMGKQKATLVLTNGQQMDLKSAPVSQDTVARLLAPPPAVVPAEEDQPVEAPVAENNKLSTYDDSEFWMTFEDGTRVHLNYHTTLKYPPHFTSNSRTVYLDGEAYFEVESDKEHPFIVKTKQLTVEATGTAFNVNAYAPDHVAAVTLVKGKVAVTLDQKKTISLSPGEKIDYNLATSLYNVNKTNTYKWCSWKDGILIFRDDPLEYVFKRLGQTYNVEFILKDAELGKYSYKATFEGESLNEILRLLEMSAPIRCKEVSNRNTNNEKFEKQRIEVSRTMQ